jgi:hypothetical protein
VSALAMAALCAGWAVLAWNTGFGGDIFIEPGRWIAELVLPVASPNQTFETKSAKSIEEAFAYVAVIRAVEHGLRAWWCAVTFWLVVVPTLTFGANFIVRRRDPPSACSCRRTVQS